MEGGDVFNQNIDPVFPANVKCYTAVHSPNERITISQCVPCIHHPFPAKINFISITYCSPINQTRKCSLKTLDSVIKI